MTSSDRPIQIGLISDTHGHFDPRVNSLFSGVDHILHAGDIGSLDILHHLEAIAHVTAVLGNTDDPSMGPPEFELVELAGFRILLHHIVDPHTPSDRLARRLKTDTPHIVIFGHTHNATRVEVDGRLYLNPGYSGRPKFNGSRSVARLTLDPLGGRPQFHVLPL